MTSRRATTCCSSTEEREPTNGPTEPSVVSCDNITTIPTDALGEQIGVLLDSQELALSEAIAAAFDLD